MQVKVFCGYPRDVVGEINEWLSKNPKNVVKKLDGAPRESDVAIYAWFTTAKTLPEKTTRVTGVYGYPPEHTARISSWFTANPQAVKKDSVAVSRGGEVAMLILYTTPRQKSTQT